MMNTHWIKKVLLYDKEKSNELPKQIFELNKIYHPEN